MSKNNIINFQEFKMNQSRNQYEKLISLLSDKKPEFSAPTNDVITSFINWLREESNKNSADRADDFTFAKWQEAVNQAYNNDIRYLCVKELNALMCCLISSRAAMKIFGWQYQHTTDKDISPKKVKIFSKLEKAAKGLQETGIELVKLLDTLREIFSVRTIIAVEQFIEWHISNLEKPLKEQASNREYRRWKRLLSVILLREIDRTYLSSRDRLHLFLSKFKKSITVSKINMIKTGDELTEVNLD